MRRLRDYDRLKRATRATLDMDNQGEAAHASPFHSEVPVILELLPSTRRLQKACEHGETPWRWLQFCL